MKMTPPLLVIGGLLTFWASTFVMVLMPVATMEEQPSEIWRPMTPVEETGHDLYVANGCSYCHTLFVRINDWGLGAERIAQSGDYEGQEPAILGTERTGPDLSQEGGEHPDDWHTAHFLNPRFTSPVSMMPVWEFLGPDKIAKLTAYMQYLGMRAADERVARQRKWKAEAVRAFRSGLSNNIDWLHQQVPAVWRNMPNPYPASPESLLRGKRTYQEFCIGCHSTVGDGEGPAKPFLDPPPLNFTTLRRHLVQGKYIGGILYYQVMNGITGTSMPYFKRALESEKIWDVSNYVAVYFIGYTDADIEPEGIDAAYEGEWFNPYLTPEEAERAGVLPFTTTRPEPNAAELQSYKDEGINVVAPPLFALLDVGVHMLDLAVWLMNNPEPVRVSATTDRRFGTRPEIAKMMRGAWDPGAFDVEDFAVALVHFANGATMLLRTSWATHIDAETFAVRLLGTEAGATTVPPMVFRNHAGIPVDEHLQVQKTNSYEREIQHWLRVVAGKEQQIVTPSETLNVQRIINGAYRSAAEHREVEVEPAPAI